MKTVFSKLETFVIVIGFLSFVSFAMTVKNNVLQDHRSAQCQSVGGKLSYVWSGNKRETVCAKLNVIYKVE